MLDIHNFKATKDGLRLLVLGGVHGNEICGPHAIQPIITEFQSGQRVLQQGRVTFIPVCNPRAYAQDKRFIDVNLNRSLRKRETPNAYEHHLMNALCPHLEACDYVLDIHSYYAGGPAFAFRGPDSSKEKEEAFIRALGINHMVYGWSDAYAANAAKPNDDEAVGTTEYARQFGAFATTLECGQHRDPSCVTVARTAIEGALGYCGLVAEGSHTQPHQVVKSRIQSVHYKEKEGALAKNWQHLDTFDGGDVLAHYADGQNIIASFAGRIIMPKQETPIGQEWFYLAKEE